MPSMAVASLRCFVCFRSISPGLGLPEGWLCTTIMELASFSTAFLMTIRESMIVALTPPTLIRSLEMSRFPLFRYRTQHSSCRRSLITGPKIRTTSSAEWMVGSIWSISLSALPESANAAMILAALAFPIPGMAHSCSNENWDRCFKEFSAVPRRFRATSTALLWLSSKVMLVKCIKCVIFTT